MTSNIIDDASCILSYNECPKRISILDNYIGDNIEYVSVDDYISYANVYHIDSEVGIVPIENCNEYWNIFVCDEYVIDSLDALKYIIVTNHNYIIPLHDIKKKTYYVEDNLDAKFKYRVRMKILNPDLTFDELSHSRKFDMSIDASIMVQ